MHLAALRIDARHDVLDRAVLAGRVHGLKDQQHRPAVLRVEPLLQLGQALDPLRQQVLGLVLFDIEVIGVAGIPVLEAEVVRIAHAIEFGKFREAHAMSLRSINGKRAQSGMRIIFLRGTVNSKPAGCAGRRQARARRWRFSASLVRWLKAPLHLLDELIDAEARRPLARRKLLEGGEEWRHDGLRPR